VAILRAACEGFDRLYEFSTKDVASSGPATLPRRQGLPSRRGRGVGERCRQPERLANRWFA